MPEFFAMHGYGAYVWSAYGVFFAVLLTDAVLPVLRRRRALAQLGARLKREAARAAASSPLSGNNA